jgi:hypothetical protein
MGAVRLGPGVLVADLFADLRVPDRFRRDHHDRDDGQQPEGSERG